MKKQILALTGTLLLSSMTFAATMTCQISTGVAKSGSLYPGDELITVSAQLNEKNLPVLVSAEGYQATCSSTKIQKLNILFCADKTEFQGIYQTAIVIEIAGDRNFNTYANAQFGTLLNGKGLDVLASLTAISPIVVKELNQADIEIPDSMNNDSYLVDEALKAALKKGIQLEENQIISLDIDTCRLN